jgi:hypothetical protein
MNDAHEAFPGRGLGKDEGKLVEAYANILTKVLLDERLKDLKPKKVTDTSAAAASGVSAEVNELKVGHIR